MLEHMTNSNRCCDLFLCFRAVSPVLAVGGGRHCSGCFVEKWLYSARFLVLQVAARGDVFAANVVYLLISALLISSSISKWFQFSVGVR